MFWSSTHVCNYGMIPLHDKKGSHSTWKTWKNDSSFSSHGIILELENYDAHLSCYQHRFQWLNSRAVRRFPFLDIHQCTCIGCLGRFLSEPYQGSLYFKSMSPDIKEVRESKGMLANKWKLYLEICQTPWKYGKS